MVVAFLLFLVAASAQSQSDCMAFCTDYMATCANTTTMMSTNYIYDIYNQTQDCINECLWYPTDSGCTDGSSATACATGNSYGCRRYHLNVAMMSAGNAYTHCPHATPLSPQTTDLMATNGSAINGTICVSLSAFTNAYPAAMPNGLLADFCNQVAPSGGSCSGYLGGLNTQKCISMYQFVTGTTDVSMYPGAMGRRFPLNATSSSQTSLPCRRYHASVARNAGNAAVHCPHALFGNGTCGNDCDTYCNVIMGVCTGTNAQYNGTSSMTAQQQCMSACGNFRIDYDYMNTNNSNTVQCRMYHISVATTNAAAAVTHCPHAGPTGAMTCVDAKSGATGISASFVVVAVLAVLAKYFM